MALHFGLFLGNVLKSVPVLLPGWVLEVILLHLTYMKAKSLMNRKMARQGASETSCMTEQKQVLLISMETRPQTKLKTVVVLLEES